MEDVSFEWHPAGSASGTVPDEIWDILTKTNHDFVPPLSARRQIPNKQLKDPATWAEPIAYYESVLTEDVILARRRQQVVGMLSFVTDFIEPQLADWSPSCYVTTVAVRLMARQQGFGRHLISHMFSLPLKRNKWLTTRTWSTNQASLSLFQSCGMTEIARVKDDRGQGIDSIYLARPFARTSFENSSR